MIQSVKCLLLKHEDLSLNPLNSCKKLDMAENAYNSSAGQVEPARRSSEACWAVSFAELVSSRCSEILSQKLRAIEEDIQH